MGRAFRFQKLQMGAQLLFKTTSSLPHDVLHVPARAAVSEPDPRARGSIRFHECTGEKGVHDLKDERWNAYGQFTYISSWKGAFPASYTNLNGSTNSLLPGSERSFTGTATLYLGLKTWQGGEIYFVAGDDIHRGLYRT